MLITYGHAGMYIYVKPRGTLNVAKTLEAAPGVLIDLGAKGEVQGVEILCGNFGKKPYLEEEKPMGNETRKKKPKKKADIIVWAKNHIS
ncbi:MAG: DUF2283 domain-containing protein [Rhodoferax sp.]|nr:DUF2283 domain-containing protein [Rhodoferax sp.]